MAGPVEALGATEEPPDLARALCRRGEGPHGLPVAARTLLRDAEEQESACTDVGVTVRPELREDPCGVRLTTLDQRDVSRAKRHQRVHGGGVAASAIDPRRQRLRVGPRGRTREGESRPQASSDWHRTSRAAGGVLVGYVVSALVQGLLAVASVALFVYALFN